MAITHPAALPITVNGVRLDSLAYNVETLTGQRSLPRTRNRDVVVPGLHGVVPSRYDDYEAGELGLRMWVRDVDENGDRPTADVHPKQQLDRNLDRLFGLFQSGPSLLDVRMATGRDMNRQTMVLTNPRCETSSGTTTAIRTNALMNPSWEASTSSTATRTNLVSNPGFELSADGWAPTGGTMARTTEHVVGGLGAGKFITDGSVSTVPETTYVRTGTYTAGQVYTAQAMVGSDQQDETPVHLRLLWRDSTNAVIQTDDGPDLTVPAIGAWTGATLPVFRQAVVSSSCPANAVRYDLTLVIGDGSDQPAGDAYYLDNVMVEQAPTAGEYFDGDSGPGYAWTGTAGQSQSTYSVPLPDNWGVASGGLLTQHVGSVVPRFGSTHGEFTVTATIGRDTQFLWSTGTNAPASYSTSGKWSASIHVRSQMDPAPRIRLRVAGLDGAGAFLGWALDANGREAFTDMAADDDWTRYTLEGVTLPTGSASCRLSLQSVDDLPEGTVLWLECATLEPNPTTPAYFDGDTPGVAWGGTAHASFSRRNADDVYWWVPTNGSFTVEAEADQYPLERSYAYGRYTVTTSSSDQRVSAPYVTPSRAVRPWQAGAYVWGRGGVTHAQVVIDGANASNALQGSQTGPLTPVTGGWVWVPGGPLWTPPDGTAKVRIRVRFYGDAAMGPAPVNSTAWVHGTFLATADGLDGTTYTPSADDYWDARVPGTTLLSVGNFVSRPGQYRQALCKTSDVISPQVEGTGTYVARLAVVLSIPSVFWTEAEDSDWTYTHTATSTWTQEIPTLRGSTAPIEDAIVVVYGPATNPKVIDPTTGAWVRLNMSVPSGQAWLIDAGRDRSAMGSSGLSPVAASWSSRRQYTDWTSPRSRLLVLHPKRDDYLSTNVVRLTVQGAAKARVIARRKWL